MKKNKKLPIDQFDDLNGWLNFYEANKKFPYDKIVCSHCKSSFVSLVGRGKKIIFDTYDSNPKRILNEIICKECKLKLNPIEKKKKEYIPETREQREARIEEIRASIPKIDFQKEIVSIDLLKNKDMCREHTKGACLRPDIFLNNDRTCDTCKLNENCSSSVKKFSKYYEKSKK